MIVDKFHKEKLKKHNINIKTQYIVENDIFERNTDDSKNDDIKNGIRCKKFYYINNILKHTETKFDSRIEYTFISQEEENKDYSCPNCGRDAKVKDFKEGCPYCRTRYNIEYTDKDLGSKYHYDRVLRSNKYRIITAIIDLVISLIISYIFIKTTSRTFNNYDVSKIFISLFILSLILYYFFYLIDAYIVLTPIKKYKDRQNQKQIEFWNRTKINKKIFFNNVNYELRKYYYSQENIIDYDILDYISFEECRKNNDLYVKVTAEIRLVYLNKNKIVSKYIKDSYYMKYLGDNTIKLNAGINIVKCYNCGSSIDVNKGYCEYCRTPIRYYQEWILEKDK